MFTPLLDHLLDVDPAHDGRRVGPGMWFLTVRQDSGVEVFHTAADFLFRAELEQRVGEGRLLPAQPHDCGHGVREVQTFSLDPPLDPPVRVRVTVDLL